MSVRHYLEASAFSIISAVGKRLPATAAVRLGEGLGNVVRHLDARHSRIALSNLELAYGDQLTSAEKQKILKACWKHFGRVAVESLRFPKRSPTDIGQDIEIEGFEHIENAYKKGNGTLLFSAHYGNWELVALMQGYLGLPLSMITRPLDNPVLERRVAHLRGLSGNTIVHKRNAAREMLKVLRSGGGVAIVIDQDAHQHGVFVPYFGTLASTTPTLATLALKTGASVIPVFSVPNAEGGYRIFYEPEVMIEPTGNHQKDVIRWTARCTQIIEDWVRKHPELWLWMHRRWKSRPEGETH